MRKCILLLLSSLIYFHPFSASFAQTIEVKRIPSGKNIVNNKIIPIEGFYMSNEITNKEYREFVDFLMKHPNDSLFTFESIQKNGHLSLKEVKNSDVLEDAIDSTVMDEKIKHYFTNKAYDNYPVVGVSYNSATLFCIWKSTNGKAHPEPGGGYIEYRLPTQSEWLHAASYLNPEWPVPDEKKGKVQPVKSGNFDKNGLYNLSDNVSEWTSTPSGTGKYYVMGGSWKTKSDKTEKAEMPANTRTNYIGFRVVTETNLRSK